MSKVKHRQNNKLKLKLKLINIMGANLDEMQTVDFLTALLFGWKSHIYCVTTVFGRFLMMDCPKHSLEHCLIGLFGWMNPVLL